MTNTWPEQDAIDKWLKEMNIKVSHSDSMKLKNAVTKIRIEVQEELDEARKESRNNLLKSEGVFEYNKQLKAKLEEAEKEIKRLREKVKNPYPPAIDLADLYEEPFDYNKAKALYDEVQALKKLKGE